MKARELLGMVGLVIATGLAPTAPARGADDETAAIKQKWDAYATAWNKHDATAMAALWAEDGDLINPWGRIATGRTEVEKVFVDEQTGKGMLRDSTFRVDGHLVRFPTADVAVSDVEVSVTGAYQPDGTKSPMPMEFHATNVWKKAGGAWWIHACRPYLKAPPAVK